MFTVNFLLRRLGTIVLMLLGLLVITFLVSHVAPSDPARLAAGPNATEDMPRAPGETHGEGRDAGGAIGIP